MKSRILVIDDEVGIRDSMRRTLEYQGYQFIGAATGQEGLALIERDPPDLVFLDIKMPRMSAREVLIQIKKNYKWSQIPIIIYSTTILPRDAADYKKLGAYDIVTKLAKFKDLCDALRIILKKYEQFK